MQTRRTPKPLEPALVLVLPPQVPLARVLVLPP